MSEEEKEVSHADLDAVIAAQRSQPEEPHAEPVDPVEPVEGAELIPADPDPEPAIPDEPDIEPDPEPAIPAEPDPDDPEGHKERSKMGRKLKAVEEQNLELRNDLAEIKALLTPKEEVEEEDDGEPVLYTKTELRELIRKESQSIAQETIDAPTRKKKEYETAYVGSLEDIEPDLEPEERETIIKEILDPKSPFCITRSGFKNPIADATTNFYAAQAARYKKQAITPKHNLKQEEPGGMGGSTGIEIPAKVTVPVKLTDPHARALAEHFFTPEEVSKILAEPIPARLHGRK